MTTVKEGLLLSLEIAAMTEKNLRQQLAEVEKERDIALSQITVALDEIQKLENRLIEKWEIISSADRESRILFVKENDHLRRMVVYRDAFISIKGLSDEFKKHPLGRIKING